MKKLLIIIGLACILNGCFFGGIRKNWKVMKNTQSILIGQSINVAENIYGTPSKTFLLPDGGTGYIWTVDRTNEVVGVDTNATSFTNGWISQQTNYFGGQTSGRSSSRVVYGSSCYIAMKTDSKGYIMKAMNEGFNTDRINRYEPECLAIFRNSRKFCNAVIRENPKKKMQDCWRKDYSRLKNSYEDLIMPSAYTKPYVTEETHHQNFFFD